ncbi:MAG: acetyl-CoA carboxylase biotin carboxyl carrier protein subunit [Clostridia bacterium]|nr:acetyl-CoA carboxylase biotin carboxyl carrier protein subunit [Clostridia bacterium]
MKKYIVSVNGVKYEVELEVSTEANAPAAPVASAPAAPVAPAAPAPVSAGAANVNAPLPATVLSVKVKNGDTVKKGDILFILEAMKMENEILAPCDGTVDSVSVANGAAVDSGALLCVIK